MQSDPQLESFTRYAPMKRLLRETECIVACAPGFRSTRRRIFHDYLKLLTRDVRKLHQARREALNAAGAFDDGNILVEQARTEVLLARLHLAEVLYALRVPAAARIAERTLSVLEGMPSATPAHLTT